MAEAATLEAPYHADPYRREIEVWVDALGEDSRFGPYLLFSDTICHPHGGGQKGDRGHLVLDGETAAALGTPERLPITDTRRDGHGNLHMLGAPVNEAAAAEVLVGARQFAFELDWAFRLRQMRLHSAAHLLHCFVERALGQAVPHPDTSDLQPDFGLNRYEIKALLDEAQLAAATEALNGFTAEGHPITTYPDEEKEGYRYWRCEEWVIPCGGTHLSSTAEIGAVKASLGLKKGRTSITFRLAD